MKFKLFSMLKRLIAIAFITAAWPVLASGGGGEAAGPAPILFIVNIGKSVATMSVLQVAIVLEFATPEAEHRLSLIKPKVQHRIILLLCGEDVASLQTTKGKQELQERIIKDMNVLIDETPDTGVKEVFFTNFVIQ